MQILKIVVLVVCSAILLTLDEPGHVKNINNNKRSLIRQADLKIIQDSIIQDSIDNININKLVEALIQVESRGNDSAIGDRHLGKPSIGVLQLRPIMVREVNRILKKQKSEKRYKLKDRFSREKSIEMFMVWKSYHHPLDNNEKIARCWNGGPRGWKKAATKGYWTKVQNELNI